MPRTVTTTIRDPRTRTKRITLDLSNPEAYLVTVARELVEEDAATGRILSRTPLVTFEESVTFKADGTPVGKPQLLALLKPIQTAIEALEVAHLTKQAADAAASALAASTTGKFA